MKAETKVEATPGPWEVKSVGNSEDHICFVTAINPRSEWKDKIHVCKMLGSYVDEIEANAKLIAAAPELLEALESMLNAITVMPRPPHPLYHAVSTSKIAIKKARGL